MSASVPGPRDTKTFILLVFKEVHQDSASSWRCSSPASHPPRFLPNVLYILGFLPISPFLIPLLHSTTTKSYVRFISSMLFTVEWAMPQGMMQMDYSELQGCLRQLALQPLNNAVGWVGVGLRPKLQEATVQIPLGNKQLLSVCCTNVIIFLCGSGVKYVGKHYKLIYEIMNQQV